MCCEDRTSEVEFHPIYIYSTICHISCACVALMWFFIGSLKGYVIETDTDHATEKQIARLRKTTITTLSVRFDMFGLEKKTPCPLYTKHFLLGQVTFLEIP